MDMLRHHIGDDQLVAKYLLSVGLEVHRVGHQVIDYGLRRVGVGAGEVAGAGKEGEMSLDWEGLPRGEREEERRGKEQTRERRKVGASG